MTPAITLFIGLTAALAGSILLYVANLRYIARNDTSSFPPWAAIPVLTPIHSWQLGARALPLAFAGVTALYVLLHLSARAGEA
jgi:hypothetical protein